MQPPLPPVQRVGAVLLIFCALHSFSVVGDLLAAQPHALSIDLMTGLFGTLLLRGHLGAARWALLCAVMGALIVGAGLPLRLLSPLPAPTSAHEWLRMVWADGWWIADLALLSWTARELAFLCPASRRA